MSSKMTLFDKVWDSHVVHQIENGPDVLFIDRHMVHEVTSPVAFLGLKTRNIGVIHPEKTFATADHNTPTINQHLPVADPLSANQLKMLEENANEHGISYWGLGHEKNGIVHVVGPEYGITLPGATIVCGDSHTSTHGAFGAIAFGIGTSEVEMVLATQCIMQPKPKKMRINITGELQYGVTPKDAALFIISQLTTSGATGYFVEYAGDVFKNMTMEGRMTVCNLSIEMGARGGMIAPDESTFHFVKGREFTPKGAEWDKAMDYWQTLYTDPDAIFDKVRDMIDELQGFSITAVLKGAGRLLDEGLCLADLFVEARLNPELEFRRRFLEEALDAHAAVSTFFTQNLDGTVERDLHPVMRPPQEKRLRPDRRKGRLIEAVLVLRYNSNAVGGVVLHEVETIANLDKGA